VVVTYQVSDGLGGTDTATLTITVTGDNDAPVAAGNSYTTAEDTPLVIAAPGVLGNDSDADADALNALLVSGPAHGSLTLNSDGSFTYTPVANYAGADAFTYNVTDGTFTTGPISVALTVTPVNDPPAGTADGAGGSYTIGEDGTLTVPAGTGVLTNDSDTDGDPLTAVLVTGPAHGTLTLNPDGSFSYTPVANYAGADSFVYRASDGVNQSGTATVSITVTGTPDAALTESVVSSFTEWLSATAAGVVLTTVVERVGPRSAG
jgi:VCBS repeat-containing protein